MGLSIKSAALALLVGLSSICVSPAATINFTGLDTSTGSNWTANYGASGYELFAAHLDSATGNSGNYYTNWNGANGNIASLPTFISSIVTAGETTVWSGNGNFGKITDPTQSGSPLINSPAVLPLRAGSSITINRSATTPFSLSVFVGVSSDGGFPNNAFTYTLTDGSGTASGSTTTVPVGGAAGTPGMAYANFSVGSGSAPLTLSFADTSGNSVNLAGLAFTAVPEPASLLLLALGCAVLLAVGFSRPGKLPGRNR